MAAILTSVIDNTDKVVEYIEECEKMGIEISKPDINKSSMRFTVDDNKIQFGLVAIKNVGRKFIEEMVYERNLNGRFSSFEDFIKRMINKDLNKRAIESLIKAGAFDSFNLTRRSLIISCDKIIKNISQQRYQNVFGQTSLFGEKEEKSDIINVDEFDKTDLLNAYFAKSVISSKISFATFLLILFLIAPLTIIFEFSSSRPLIKISLSFFITSAFFLLIARRTRSALP